MRISLREQTAAALSKLSEEYQADPSLIARAALETVIKDGTIHAILSEVEISDYEVKKGRIKGRGMYRFNGERLSSEGIAGITGIPGYLIRRRLELGWDLERAAWTPAGKSRFKKEASA